ncbi:hypothetical protein OIU80_17065 [Flavobacterium sp. LS1R47]|uniref:Uncharacterized protein n=1 Tax=Flavobacterium frigoritolerans TaxID=2987686 RepID=A0A9X3HM98_9FLAO|nr:hypothetical protein [Flavobacterium frigoritolerans]MCV9933995.1 hypothetical protein [Flavobacterium frigoritolerans]
MIINTLPLFVSAQTHHFITDIEKDKMLNQAKNQAEQKLQQQNSYIELPKTLLLKPLSRNRIENAEAKLVREERKLKKLENEAQEKKDDLKTKQEKLLNLKNALKNTNNSDRQKNIERTKEQIAKIQNELNKIKILIESRSKKVTDLEIAMEEAKFKREEDY